MTIATNNISKNLQRFKIAINSHDRENPDHSSAYGIAMNNFDLERLGFDDGEEIWPGVVISADSGVTGNFRVLCEGNHTSSGEEVEEVVAKGIMVDA